jgi:hypothetical protein
MIDLPQTIVLFHIGSGFFHVHGMNGGQELFPSHRSLAPQWNLFDVTPNKASIQSQSF